MSTSDTTSSSPPLQHTLAAPVTVSGLGLFRGEPCTVTIEPGEPDTGIVFVRVDVEPEVRIPALVENVTVHDRRTTLKSGETTIETIEHCMSAFAGLAIDNAVVRVHGPELPGGDGSALCFLEPLLEVGRVEQDAARRMFDLRETIVVDDGKVDLYFWRATAGLSSQCTRQLGRVSWCVDDSVSVMCLRMATHTARVAGLYALSMQC